MRIIRPLALICLAFGLVSGSVRAAVPVYSVEVIKTYPHDTEAFTEGLYYRDGSLFESTGRNGQSFIRQVDLATGKVMRQTTIDKKYFGEGIAPWGDHIVSLTWTGGAGFVWSGKDFKLKHSFFYTGEGWGLTGNDKNLIMSDGTSTIRFLDPVTLKTTRTIAVTLNGRAIDQLNELEWIDGQIYANVWRTRDIARIDPETGKITGIIELDKLPETQDETMDINAVANGIAYDAKAKRLFVTGKLWPNLYEVRLVPKQP
ncbi:MAG: glutaminyl-peptide cyclotransferase [Asticcacaulis sp.]|uniref:glutaminyl-peptide cyclotransferase n=1 Tax=Asticcacaulis sp. TaxID=1872648 RepID=UPI0039E5007C